MVRIFPVDVHLGRRTRMQWHLGSDARDSTGAGDLRHRTLEPYNPQLTHHGRPAERVNFTVSGLPRSSATTYFRCSIRVFHSGRQVGAMSVVSGASARQSVSVEVRGEGFAGKPSDAHILCHVSTSPLLR